MTHPTLRFLSLLFFMDTFPKNYHDFRMLWFSLCSTILCFPICLVLFPSFSSSITAECYGIINVLQFILSLDYNEILIASDYQSCLLAISFNLFKSFLFSSHIPHQIFCLENKHVPFLWISSHASVTGKRHADLLTFFPDSIHIFLFLKFQLLIFSSFTANYYASSDNPNGLLS